LKNRNLFFLTETQIEDREFKGRNVFRGYYTKQVSSSGRRAGGVVVFVKKRIEYVEESAYNCLEGHYTLGVYKIDGMKIIVVGVYSDSSNIDREASRIMEEIRQKIGEYVVLHSTTKIIVSGDFNLHLDTEHTKKQACKNLRRIIEQYSLIDLGEDRKESTWRRPGRARINPLHTDVVWTT